MKKSNIIFFSSLVLVYLVATLTISNINGSYAASNNDSIEHSGRLLKETGITLEEIEAEISFDLIINLESDVSFKANIKQNIPIGNIANEGTISKEITNLKNIVFKREQ